MLRFLEHRIGDRRLLRLISKWLKAGVMEEGVVTAAETGAPQGAVVSPMLANVYLHYVFDLWAHRWRQHEVRGRSSSCVTPTMWWRDLSMKERPSAWRTCGSGWQSLRYRCTRTRRD